MDFSEVWLVLCLGLTLPYRILRVRGRWLPAVLKRRLSTVTRRASPCENGQGKEGGVLNETFI